MKILFVEWKSYGYLDIKDAFIEEGHQIISFPFKVFEAQGEELLQDQDTEDRLCRRIRKEVPDIVFSVDRKSVV